MSRAFLTCDQIAGTRAIATHVDQSGHVLAFTVHRCGWNVPIMLGNILERDETTGTVYAVLASKADADWMEPIFQHCERVSRDGYLNAYELAKVH